jgi:hypothetical protein
MGFITGMRLRILSLAGDRNPAKAFDRKKKLKSGEEHNFKKRIQESAPTRRGVVTYLYLII